MKKSLVIYLMAAATLLSACKFEYPLPVILSNPAFENSGYQRYTTISIYPESPLNLTLQRTSGLSKELVVDVLVDEAVLEEYNRVNKTSHKMLPAKYYKLDATATFEALAKEALVTGTVYAADLVRDLGREGASGMVIPIRIEGKSAEVESKSGLAEMLLSLQIVDPRVDVESKSVALNFIPISPLKQTVTLKAQANFNSLETSKVAYTVDPSLVETYAAEHAIDVSLLAADRYVIGTPVFDPETMTLTTEVTLDCASIGGDGKYLLPLRFTETAGYEVVQKNPIYILVEMSQLVISISGSGEPVQTRTGVGEIELTLNTALPDDQAIALKYAPERVTEYNAAHGTDYVAMDASKVSLGGESSIPAGAKSGKIPFLISIADLPYDTGHPFLLPFVIDATPLMSGTVYDADETYWLLVDKSRLGVYSVTELSEGLFAAGPHKAATHSLNHTYRKMYWPRDTKQNEIYPSDDCPANRFQAKYGQPYAVHYADKWEDGVLFFDVDTTPMEGFPTRYALINLQDRCPVNEKAWGWSEDEVTYNACYFDEADGSFFFDFVIDNGSTAFEMAYRFTR